jgi:hypothetical protein
MRVPGRPTTLWDSTARYRDNCLGSTGVFAMDEVGGTCGTTGREKERV